MNPNVRWGLYALGGISILSLLSKWTGTDTPQYNKQFIRQIGGVVTRASQSHTTSSQDTNLLVALLNANSGLAYLNAARRIAKDADIERITGIDVVELQHQLEDKISTLTSQIVSKCPSLKSTYVVPKNIAWI